jgi:hypothetical protein
MGSDKHTADVVLHNMIEQIYFQSIIFSKKEMGSAKHMADVVLPVADIRLIKPLLKWFLPCWN